MTRRSSISASASAAGSPGYGRVAVVTAIALIMGVMTAVSPATAATVRHDPAPHYDLAPPVPAGTLSVAATSPVAPVTQPVGSPSDSRHQLNSKFQSSLAAMRTRMSAPAPRTPDPLLAASAKSLGDLKAQGTLAAAHGPGDPVYDRIVSASRAAAESGSVSPRRAGAAVTPDTSTPCIGASYTVATSWTVLPTFWQNGVLHLSILNTGSCGWAPNSFYLGEHIFSSNPGPNPCTPAAGSLYDEFGDISAPTATIEPGQTWSFDAQAPELPAGTFTIAWDMFRSDASTGGVATWFSCDYQVPSPAPATAVTVPHHAPIETFESPDQNGTETTNRPQFGVLVQDDATQPVAMEFNICPLSGACVDSGWVSVAITAGHFSSSPTWTPPAGVLAWNTVYTWKTRVKDSSYTNPWSSVSQFTTIVPQPAGSGHFGVNPGSLDAVGVNLFLGNYTRQEHDLALPTPGLPLAVNRVYNSASAAVGVFGVGWSSILDTAWSQNAATGIVTVTFPDGHQVNYGPNPDGSWASGYGQAKADLYALGGDQCVHLPAGTYYCFGPNGKLDFMADASKPGDQLSFTEDSSGRIIQITDVQSTRSLYIGWSGARPVMVSSAPAGTSGLLTWTYHYAGVQLSSSCDPRGTGATFCTAYTYTTDSAHPNGRLSFIDPPSGRNWTQITYSGEVVASVTHPDGVTGGAAPAAGDSTWHYTRITPTDGNPLDVLTVEVSDPNGVNTWYGFDTNDDLAERSIGATAWLAGHSRWWSYDFQGRVTAVTDENVNTKLYAYDDISGQINSTTVARDGDTSITHSVVYDNYGQTDTSGDTLPPTGLVLTATDGNGHTVTNTYDEYDDRLTTTSPPTAANPSGGTTTTGYTCENGAPPPPVINDPTAVAGAAMPCYLPLRVTSPANLGTITYGYDRFGDPTQETTSAGLTTNLWYDANGRITSKNVATAQHPAGIQTTYTNDALGNVLTETDPAVLNPITGITHQRRVTNTYDTDGNQTVVATSDVTGGDTTRAVTYGYDKRDRRSSETDNGALVSASVFDALGRQVQTTTAKGTVYQFTYDAGGNLTSTTLKNYEDDPLQHTSPPRDVRVQYFTYDPAGRTASSIDAMGHEVDYQYTDDNLLASETLVNFHDPNGRQRPISLHSYTYDAVGNVTDDVEGSGPTARHTHTTFDAANEPTTVTYDPSGLNRTTTNTYDSLGQLAQITLSDGSRTETTGYQYNPSSGPGATKTLIHNDTTADLISQVTRDPFGKVLTSTDPRGTSTWTSTTAGDPAFTTTLTYDALERLSTTTQPAVPTEDGTGTAAITTTATSTVGYDAFGDTTNTRDARGDVTTTKYDTSGRVIEVDYPTYTPPTSAAISPTDSWAYDAAGNATSHTDRLGQTTYTKYDARNRPFRITEPSADGSDTVGISTRTYDDNGNLLSTIDATGAQVLRTYDDMDRVSTLVSVERIPAAASFTTNYTYDDFGDPLTAVTAHTATTASYDTAGDRLSLRTTGQGTMNYTYDVAGRVTRTTDPLGRVMTTTYDLAGQPVNDTRLANTGGFLAGQSYSYDLAGNLTSLTDPNGHTWQTSYDARNQRRTLTDPTPTTAAGTTLPTPVTTLGYDATGNQTRTTDANNHTTYTTYTPWNQPQTILEPATTAQPAATDRTWTTTYNPAGEPTVQTQPGAVTVTTTYDNAGRAIQQSGTGADAATTTRSLSYDWNNRVTNVTTDTGSDAITYDDRGDVVNSYVSGYNGGWANFFYRYDAEGRLIESHDPGGATDSVMTYTYSGLDQMASATNVATHATTTYSYDTAGELTGQANTTSGTANGSQAYTYDQLGRESTATTADPVGAVETNIAYSYDHASNMTGQTTSGNITDPRSQSFTYDTDGRLVRAADLTASTGTDYTWDSTGNRTAATTWIGTPSTTTGTTTAAYDQRNRLLSTTTPTATTTTSWTPRGTPTSTTTGASTTTSTYDAFGQLISDGHGATYGYDSLGRLDQQYGHGAYYHGLNAQPDSFYQGATAVTYTLTPDGEPLTQTQGTTSANLVTDTHGDVMATTDPTTSHPLSSRAYDPFGAITATTGTPSPLGYQGDYTDTTGSIHTDTRWYTPGTATFTTQDATPNLPLDTASDTNHYTYANANPTSLSDPSGRNPISSVLDGIATDIDAEFQGIIDFNYGADLAALGEGGAVAAETAGDAVAGGVVTGGLAAVCAAVCLEAAAATAVVGSAALIYWIASNGSASYQQPAIDPDTGLPYGAEYAATHQTPLQNPNTTQVHNPATHVTPRTVLSSPTRTTYKTWTHSRDWYHDGYLYNRTDRYTYIRTQSWNYYSDGSSDTHWTTTKTDNWTITATPVIDLRNPTLTIEKPRTPTPANNNAPAATTNGTCGSGGDTTTCLQLTGQPLPQDANTTPQTATSGNGANDNGGDGTGSPSDECTPEPNNDSGPSYNDLVSQGANDAHHIIQNAAVRDLGGYVRGLAPAIQLGGPSTLVGSSHYLATAAQRLAGGGTYGAERQIAYNALRAGGVSQDEALDAISRADNYFMGSLCVGLDTPTRMPGNRAAQ